MCVCVLSVFLAFISGRFFVYLLSVPNHNNVCNNIHSPSVFIFSVFWLDFCFIRASLEELGLEFRLFFFFFFALFRSISVQSEFLLAFFALLWVADDSYIFQIFSPYLIEDLHIFSAFSTYILCNMTEKCFLILVKCPFSLQASFSLCVSSVSALYKCTLFV